jgi:hypothetical protein
MGFGKLFIPFIEGSQMTNKTIRAYTYIVDSSGYETEDSLEEQSFESTSILFEREGICVRSFTTEHDLTYIGVRNASSIFVRTQEHENPQDEVFLINSFPYEKLQIERVIRLIEAFYAHGYDPEIDNGDFRFKKGVAYHGLVYNIDREDVYVRICHGINSYKIEAFHDTQITEAEESILASITETLLAGIRANRR